MNAREAIGDRKLVVFGAGYYAEKLAHAFGDQIAYYVDNDAHKQGSRLFGKEVRHPSVLPDEREAYIVVSTPAYYAQIAEQLENMGFLYCTHFTSIMALFEHEAFAAAYPLKQLLIEVTNSCNSRCTMCGMWKNPPGMHITSERFREIVTDAFYTNVRQLRISGGEPTLVDHLPMLCAIAVEKLPCLEELVLNINCLLPQRALQFIEEIAEKAGKYGIRIVASLSLNGVGEAHDGNRGVPGNYEKVIEVIEGIEKLALPNVVTQISARIVKQNVWDVEAFVVELVKRRLKQCFFLLAGRMDALHNADYVATDAFDEDELYQIKLAFMKFPHYFGNDMVYEQLFHQLDSNGQTRLVSCYWEKGWDLAVRLDGRIAYCQIFTHPLEMTESSVRENYSKGLKQLHFMRHTKCRFCYFCCAYVPTPKYDRYVQERAFWNDFYTLDAYDDRHESMMEDISQALRLPIHSHPEPQGEQYVVLITGWYGTETVGDKAILGQIIDEVQQRREDTRILITSAYPFITHRTLYELGAVAEVVPLFDKLALQWAARADEVIMGGGPLMEMEWLSIPLWLFSIAKHHGRRTVIRGCGIGPIYGESAEKAVCAILRLADAISLRDQDSADWAYARLRGENISITVSEDPAVPYIRARYKQEEGFSAPMKELACFLRELTFEYEGHRSEAASVEYRKGVEDALAHNIKKLCMEKGLVPHFYAIHNFVVGNDDRDFNHRFVDAYFDKGSYRIDKKLTSIEKVTSAMNESALSLCMRFHSVVFADTLERPYIAIDYTNGGKITAFMGEHGDTARMVTVDGLLDSDTALLDVLTS